MPNGADRYYYMKILEEYDIRKWDKISLFGQTYRQDEWDLDALPVFEELYKQYGYEFYLDMPIHCGKEGNKAVADFLMDYIEAPFAFGTHTPVQSKHERNSTEIRC